MDDTFDEDKGNDHPHVCAEISYRNDKGENVHSDLCASDISQWSDEEYRKFLHAALDEFLDSRDPTGTFMVGTYPNPE